MCMSIMIQGSTIHNSQFNKSKMRQSRTNSTFNTQHSTFIICAPSNVIPLSLFFPKAVVC